MKRNCVSSHFCLSLNLKDLLDLMADMHFSAAHCGPLAHISKVCWDSKVDSHAVLQILDKIIERNQELEPGVTLIIKINIISIQGVLNRAN